MVTFFLTVSLWLHLSHLGEFNIKPLSLIFFLKSRLSSFVICLPSEHATTSPSYYESIL